MRLQTPPPTVRRSRWDLLAGNRPSQLSPGRGHRALALNNKRDETADPAIAGSETVKGKDSKTPSLQSLAILTILCQVGTYWMLRGAA